MTTEDKIYGIYTKDEFDELKEISSCTGNWSKNHCEKKDVGGMEEWAKSNADVEEDFSCDWYHSAWPILRVANMVAVPKWYEFYVGALVDFLKKIPKAKIMISACADYGMLAKLHKAIIKTDSSPEIFIYDICETPLRSSEWYASRHDLDVLCKCENILTADIPENYFDLIVTDEFLSVLKDDYKPIITDKWHGLLKPGGRVVTTAMVGGITTIELRKYYEKRALEFFNNNPDVFNGKIDSKTINEKCSKFAMFHTRHMIKDENQLRSLFGVFSYLSLKLTTTPGECVNPTNSYQIIAEA